jgi:hypothetical protein
MSRVHFTFFLIAIAVPYVSLQAEEPAKKIEFNVGGGTSTITSTTVTNHPLAIGATNVGQSTQQTTQSLLWAPGLATGGTNVAQGTFILTPAPGGGPVNNLVPSSGPNFVPAPGSFGGSVATFVGIDTPIAATGTSTACQPGKAFYIITEGAGLGDNVRCLPCTGNETVLDAISKVNGLSQISSTRMWIARPSPTSHDNSTILDIDWEAISRRGINTTNYTLMPGDRLVIGEDPLIKRTNFRHPDIALASPAFSWISAVTFRRRR